MNRILSKTQLSDNVYRMDVEAPLIGEAIRRTHNNESINDLFNHE